ncbi:MAG: hypothetical protein ACF8R7_01195 [Phycisphaerales bacterium JB039]
MKLRDTLARLNRLQKTRGFKLVASIAVAAAAIALLVSYAVLISAPGELQGIELPDRSQVADEQLRAILESADRAQMDLLQSKRSLGTIALGVGAGAGVALLAVWLGIGLTYLGLGLIALLIAGPLILAEAAFAQAAGGGLLSRSGDLGKLLLGVVALTMSFTALLEGLRVAFAALPGPVFAVSRNVLSEAVRMKVSLIFIVLLIFGLAALPGLLDPDTPLRYRVQSFLQYGTGGAFWIIALLTLLLSVSTVATEQRDRIIWQTMTKPVAAWQYILGKWLGVVALAAALLLVCGSAVLMFTEYLKLQPAVGEEIAFVATAGGISDDRMILQNQILQARRTVEAETQVDRSSEEFRLAVDTYIENQRQSAIDFQDTAETRQRVADDLYKQLVTFRRSVEPGMVRTFTFTGLQDAARDDRFLMLRYRINAGNNRPDETYRITLLVREIPQPIVQEVGLGSTHVFDEIPSRAISPDGTLDIAIVNGVRVFDPETRQWGVMGNPLTMTFPPGGLEISYPVGGYQMNYLRALAALWVKLAFLAMLGVAASTFLSFPVACLIAFGAFFAAESASFLNESLEVYNPGEGIGAVIGAIVVPVARAVVWTFSVYSDLKPTTRIVNGQLISWGGLALGILVLGVWSVALYIAGTVIFRNRELAIYSGH